MATKITISDFKKAFNGGSRSNRFVVEGTIPFANKPITKFHIKTTALPSLSSQTTEYNYFGRKAYYPNESSYQTWSLKVLDDTGANQDLWKMFNVWSNRINNHLSNKSSILTKNSDYKAYNWKIKHLNLNGDERNPLKTVILHGCWPKSVMPMGFNMANTNALNEFDVVFVYDWIEIPGVTKRL